MSVAEQTRRAATSPDDAAPVQAATAPTVAPTAAALENPYRRIFTKTPDFTTLVRRAYDAEKTAAAPAAAENATDKEKIDEKNASADG